MSNALAIATPAGTFADVEPAFELAGRLAKTEFVPRALHGRPEAIMAAILAGGELGIAPLVALRTIHIIEGKPTLAAEIQRALIRAAGHRLWTDEYTSRKVTLCGQRAGDDDVHKVSWELGDAERAGLASKQNWRRYPRQMLLARATSELARLAFADVTAGMYAPEDFDEIIDVAGEPTTAPTSSKRKRASRRRETVDVAAPALATAPERAKPETAPQAPPPPPLPGEAGFDDLDIVEGELVDPAAREAPVSEPRDTTAAQRLVIHAQSAKFDDDLRHELAEMVTHGRGRSFNDFDDDELAIARSIIDDVRDGTAELTYGDDGELVLHRLAGTAPTETPPLPLGDLTAEARASVALDGETQSLGGYPQSAAEWRYLAASYGITGAGVLLTVARLAPELGIAQADRPLDSGPGLDAWLDKLGGAGEIVERLHRELTTDPPF
jgi:hypothetical protein